MRLTIRPEVQYINWLWEQKEFTKWRKDSKDGAMKAFILLKIIAAAGENKIRLKKNTTPEKEIAIIIDEVDKASVIREVLEWGYQAGYLFWK